MSSNIVYIMANIINKNEEETLSFEDFKNENGLIFWWASELMKMLGYPNMKTFQQVLNRATKAFVSLNIPHYENIIAVRRVMPDGSEIQDFKLTRFACYITVMNSNPKRVEVAKAQAYFAQQTRKFELYMENSQDIDRILIRDELTEGNKSLASTIKQAGVENYANFMNAGYLGMYNMESWRLEKKRGVGKNKLFDYMGRTELAANLFRVTQTEERIKSKNIKGQKNLEQTHYQVGREVRKIVQDNVGKSPEHLPQGKQLPEIKKELKQGYKNMTKEDSNYTISSHGIDIKGLVLKVGTVSNSDLGIIEDMVVNLIEVSDKRIAEDEARAIYTGLLSDIKEDKLSNSAKYKNGITYSIKIEKTGALIFSAQ